MVKSDADINQKIYHKEMWCMLTYELIDVHTDACNHYSFVYTNKTAGNRRSERGITQNHTVVKEVSRETWSN